MTDSSWNDSLDGEALWTSANLGEAVPDVMTPATWSAIQLFMSQTMVGSSVDGHRLYGNIGGRFYMNLSLTKTLGDAFGQGKRVKLALEQAFGLPPGFDVPPVKVSRWRALRELTGESMGFMWRLRKNQKQLDRFLRESAATSARLRGVTAAQSSGPALADLWDSELAPYFRACCEMLAAATRKDGDALLELRRDLTEMVGESDANALATGIHGDGGPLASLEPIIGLQRLARGDIDRAEYAERYGHRGPHEFEMSWARPAEDPNWIDDQLVGVRESKQTLEELLDQQGRARDEAWTRFRAQHPDKAQSYAARIDKWGVAARDRESARSELIRGFWVVRAFLVRAGELTGSGDDVFFLELDEVLAVLRGRPVTELQDHIRARRATYEHYRALPSYPVLIRAPFDPDRWASDLHRRTDVYDSRADAAPAATQVRGYAGAAGVVEAKARVVETPEEGDALEDGEVMVTRVTNVGWTPLFLRAGAIVTDVGAPLSHAAIVAREMGIPAVVGCGNATMLINTGDLVRVDGGAGTVEILLS